MSKKLFVEDCAKMATNFLGAAFTAKQEFTDGIKLKIASEIEKMDFITRDEYNTHQTMLSKTIAKIAELEEKIKQLEQK